MIHTKAKLHNPRFLTPSGVAETGQRDGRDTQEALARSGVRLLAHRSQPAPSGAGGRQRPHPGRASFNDELEMIELEEAYFEAKDRLDGLRKQIKARVRRSK